MKIGIVGMGIVGNANYSGFNMLGHELVMHDIKFDTSIDEVKDTEIVYLCVPTPTVDDRCDTSIVESVIAELAQINYTGIIAIRSTVYPGFTEQMNESYTDLSICFVPEFLRERCAADDFINNHTLLAVGTNDPHVYKKIVESHGHLPKNTKQLSPTEAEILKYFNNTFAALRIVFANILYEVCEKLECDYSKVKDSYVLTGKTVDLYLDVNKKLRGYGGMCLPKDVLALASVLEDLDLDFNLIKSIDSDNKKLNSTVFNGMRNG
jgi:UDPglucose 6-dehydrogenase